MEIERQKYPRTFHVPWSPGATDDDKFHNESEMDAMFRGREVVVTEKLDGENTTVYSDGSTHARSISSASHPSRSWIRGAAAVVGPQLPVGWRLLGENMYAQHSITYDRLSSYFVVFGVVDEHNFSLGWDDVETWTGLLDLPHAPVVWRGMYDEAAIRKAWSGTSSFGSVGEGYVIRTVGGFPMTEFSSHVAKYVRKGHVQTDEHWMYRDVVPNRISSNG